MWVLVFWICTNYNCVSTVTPGYYTDKTICEDAAKALRDGDSAFASGVMQTACMKAPDNLGIE